MAHDTRCSVADSKAPPAVLIRVVLGAFGELPPLVKAGALLRMMAGEPPALSCGQSSDRIQDSASQQLHSLCCAVPPCSACLPCCAVLCAGEKVTSLAAGTTHSLASTNSGEVLSWGQSDYGALGLEPGGSWDCESEVQLPAGRWERDWGVRHFTLATGSGEQRGWGKQGGRVWQGGGGGGRLVAR